jgi:hypothetical protein
MLIFVCCLLAVLLSASLYGFLYCLHRYRDGLRSERYSLSRLAIERSKIGDSVAGYVSIDAKDIDGMNASKREVE